MATTRQQILQTVTIHPAERPTGEVRRIPEEFVVGAMLGPETNGSLDCLLAAFSSLQKTGRPARLVIFGAHCQQELAVIGASHELGGNVLCVREELSTLASLQACDVLISLQEGVPLLVLQAMSSRIPVITAAIRVPEVIQHERTAMRIRHGDTNSLEDALVLLAERMERRAEMGALAQQSIAQQYSDTNLRQIYPSHNTHEGESKSRALMKRALFGAIPKSHLFKHGNRERAQIAFTIDDGPDPVYTPQILDTLRKYGVKATFFVVGGCAEQYPDIVARMVQEGHEVGNHSYSHPYFQRLSWRGATQEIKMTSTVLNCILGKKCRLFRPPFGKLSPRSLIPAWATGQRVVMWSVDLKDYCARPGEVEAKLTETPLSSGDIILYHGVSEASITALPHVIEAALDKGRKAVTISEIIRR
jgi:peptidoglycan-N-acetylglucosamine deacetylase